MPTPTYYNLPVEKQNRILDAAIDEFSRYHFAGASINRMIKAAGIPRGSFYQYFKDKEDLYIFIIQKIGKEKLEVLAAQPMPSEDASFFEIAIAAIPAILEWVERCPKYNRIGMLMVQDNTEFIKHTISQMTASKKSVLAYLERDREQGLIREDVNLELVMELMTQITSSLLGEYYEQGGKEKALEKTVETLRILAYGIFTKRD